MNRAGNRLWTIQQLSDEVSRALGGDYSGVSNGRVRDVPDLRTIRYYTTLGLLDRAAEMRGRTAFYGGRHLLQLVAIKRLQAQGLSLAQVQRQLAGAPDAVLRKLSGVETGATGATSDRSSSTGGDGRAAGVLESHARRDLGFSARARGIDRNRPAGKFEPHSFV